MNKKRIIFFITAMGVLLVTGSVFLMTANPAKAQCGSQASSCKNCHETQAQDPVNNDGTAWHTQHAFGDFCYLCHAGNNQATDKATAHTGMVDPLSDVDRKLQELPSHDAQAKAQIYATTLGLQIGTGAVPGLQQANQERLQPLPPQRPAATQAVPGSGGTAGRHGGLLPALR